jgi:hypothetical protein
MAFLFLFVFYVGDFVPNFDLVLIVTMDLFQYVGFFLFSVWLRF